MPLVILKVSRDKTTFTIPIMQCDVSSKMQVLCRPSFFICVLQISKSCSVFITIAFARIHSWRPTERHVLAPQTGPYSTAPVYVPDMAWLAWLKLPSISLGGTRATSPSTFFDN